MSPLISRILLTIVLFPLAGMFNLVAYIILEILEDRFFDDAPKVLLASLLTAAFMVIFWLLLWRKTVTWTPARVRRTFLVAFGAALAAAGVGVIVGRTVPYSGDDVAVYVGCTLAPLLWIAATLFVWRESKPERSARLQHVGADTIVCPACAYNLTGLREARCPECGASYTLNELLAGQPSRATAEIETA